MSVLFKAIGVPISYIIADDTELCQYFLRSVVYEKMENVVLQEEKK